MSRNLLKNLGYGLVGIIILSIGLNMILIANIGAGPFDTFVMANQKILGIDSFANASFFFHVIFVVIMLVFKNFFNTELKSALISVLSIFVITRFIALFDTILYALNFDQLNIIFLLICGFLLFSFGIYVLSISNLIIAPYDKFVVEFASSTNISLGTFRVIWDVTMLILAFIISKVTDAGVVFSVGTLLITVGTGSCIRMFEVLHKRLINQLSIYT